MLFMNDEIIIKQRLEDNHVVSKACDSRLSLTLPRNIPILAGQQIFQNTYCSLLYPAHLKPEVMTNPLLAQAKINVSLFTNSSPQAEVILCIKNNGNETKQLAHHCHLGWIDFILTAKNLILKEELENGKTLYFGC